MSERASTEPFMHIPADERRLAGARDVYQTARRLRPVLQEIFKEGGWLDSHIFGDTTIKDPNSLATDQLVGGRKIPQMTASRLDQGAYCAVEVGYLRHIPNAPPNCPSSIVALLASAREVALASYAHLELPLPPVVTLDPIHIPPPNNLVYGGIFETFSGHNYAIQSLQEDTEATNPLLLWKLDPEPGSFRSVGSSQPFNQGDLIINYDKDTRLDVIAQTIGFIQPLADPYRAVVYEHTQAMWEKTND